MNLDVETQLAENKTINRIASLDFQRGLAIFMMVFLHSIQHIYDISWAADINQLFQKNILIILGVILLAFFGGWAGYFLIISAIVNSLAMTKKANKGSSLEQILIKQLLTGVGILIAAMFTEGIMGYYGFLGSVIRGLKEFSYSSFLEVFLGRTFFLMETLQAIGWCMIINAIIHYLLMINTGKQKYNRNIIIYLVLTVVIIVVSPFVWNFVDSMDWGYDSYTLLPYVWPSEVTQEAVGTFKASFFTLVAGDLEPLFPFLATSFLGSAIGLALSKPKPDERLPFYGGLTAGVFFVVGGIMIAVGMPFNFGWGRPYLTYFMLLMGTWVGVIFLLLYKVEYRGKPEKFANRKFVRVMRLWGIIALTVYALQIFSLLPRWFLSLLLSDVNLVREKLEYGEAGYVLLISLFVVLCYHILIKIWSKINFKFSFEWFIIRLASFGSKQDVSKRLDVDVMMNKTHWISFHRDNLYRTSALMLCVLFGFLGMHRFYVGKKKTAFLYLVTGGLFTIGIFYDIYLIVKGKQPFTMDW
ncbi:MAG: TM2 domain-containing protein [Candidatus Heimdallarchaeaceae archaeon]